MKSQVQALLEFLSSLTNTPVNAGAEQRVVNPPFAA